MKVTALVIGKESFNSKGKDFFKVILVIIACSELKVLVGKTVEKLVESDIYNMLDVAPTTAIDFNIDLKQAYRPEYANLHLEVDLLGFAEPEKNETEPTPGATDTKPENPVESVSLAVEDKKNKGKEEKICR